MSGKSKTLRTVEFKFNWSDGAGAPICFLRNEGERAWTFARAEIVQGTTAGSVTAGVVALNLPTTHYTMTTPAAFPVGGVTSVNPIGQERIDLGDYIQATATTASGSAKDATLRLHYWQE